MPINTNPYMAAFYLRNWSRAETPSLAEYLGYENNAVDAWLAALTGTHSETQRLRALSAINALVIHDLPVIWLYHPYIVHAYSGRLQNLDMVSQGFSPSYLLNRTWLAPPVPQSK